MQPPRYLETPETCQEPSSPEYLAMQGERKHLRECPNCGGGWVDRSTCEKCPEVWEKYWSKKGG